MNGVNAKQRPLQIRAQCLMGVIEARTDGRTVSEGPDLGGPDCGQQVPKALSVCIITHFLPSGHLPGHRRIKGHKRVDSSSDTIHQQAVWV